MEGVFCSVNPEVIAALMSGLYIRGEKRCITTLELQLFVVFSDMWHLVTFLWWISLNTERVYLFNWKPRLSHFSERQKSDSDLCGLFYVSHAALLFPINTFISPQRDKFAPLDSPGPKWWNQAAIQDFDAESKLLWQRFTTSAGQLSEAISVHLWILGACLCLRASGPVSLRCAAKDKSLVTPFVRRSIAKPSSITCLCMCVRPSAAAWPRLCVLLRDTSRLGVKGVRVMTNWQHV